MPTMFGCSNTPLVILLLVFQLTKSASGSCLSYGHSCWGGHGKRSSGIQLDHDMKNTQLFTAHTESPLKNQWELEDLPDIHMMQQMDNESNSDLVLKLSAKEQENEDEIPGDLLFVADENIDLPHKLALRRVLKQPKRKLEKMKILQTSP